jgi:hypothetical protein
VWAVWKSIAASGQLLTVSWASEELATRIVSQAGYDVANLSGGYLTIAKRRVW